MTSKYTVTMIYSIFSWLLQFAKAFYTYCPIYREANWIVIITPSSVWSCFLFNRKPQSNQKTRSLGIYLTFCSANKITLLKFSKYITGNHWIRTTHSSCSDFESFPALCIKHLETTASRSHVTQTVTLRIQDTLNVIFLQIPSY